MQKNGKDKMFGGAVYEWGLVTSRGRLTVGRRFMSGRQ
jgi:hypothetical protein